MRVICAWCKNILVFGDEDDHETHGICLVCAGKLLEDAGIDPIPFFRAYLRMKQPDRIYREDD